MTTGTMKSLTIKHLRGSVVPFSLVFEKGKKLTIIYGENGTGKSTICDALDLLGKGNVGSLDNRGLGKTHKYWHSVGKTSGDVRVELETSTGLCSATLVKSGVIVTPPEQRPRVEVLRRSQILSLVEAKPADRYNAISRFIDVSGVEVSETALRQLIRDIENEIKDAIVRIQENRDGIERYWEHAGRPDTNPLAWATAEAHRDQSALDTRKAAIEALKNAFHKLLDYPQRYSLQITNCTSAREALDSARTSVEDLQSHVADDYLEILDLLQVAQRHFTRHPAPESCPLCESTENVVGLVAKVSQRIASQSFVHQLKAAQKTAEDRQRAADSQNQRLADIRHQALDDAENFTQFTRSEHLPSGIGLPSLPSPVDLNDWAEWLTCADKLLKEWDKIAEDCTDTKRSISMLKSSLEGLNKAAQIQHELDEVLPRLKRTLEISEDERRRFTDEILHNISSEVGRLYESVHPGEGLNKIALDLDSGKRASLEIAAEFHSHKKTPPQAYFSGSHLDTLGLCVFLALAQMEIPEDTILVLDDVLGSVDEPHVERLIEMLHAEALKFKQCIITTHYRPWKEKWRWGWLKNNGQCQFIELHKWTPVRGISLTRSIPNVERLRALLAESSPDPQLVCAKAGVILEAALDFLTLLYECRVPRRADGLYTLGDLLPAVDKKLRAALRVEHKHEYSDGSFSYSEKMLAPHLDELTRIAQARNVFGCHFNRLSFDLLDTDALAFGREVLALLDALIDHEAGWPKSSKSGSYWATAGETRRLHPLKRPT